MTNLSSIIEQPRHSSYDVVIVGGAVIGSSVAFFLATNDDFDGSILVVEREGTLGGRLLEDPRSKCFRLAGRKHVGEN